MVEEKNTITRKWSIKIKLDTAGMKRTDSIPEQGAAASQLNLRKLDGVHFLKILFI